MARTEPSLLAYVAALHTSQLENVATDALGFILRSCPPAVAALARRIGVEDSGLHVINQFIGEAGRPDLAFMSRTGPRAFIEAKFWAGLTDAQPAEYVNLLDRANGGTVAFVAPTERHAALWAELMNRSSGFTTAPGSPLAATRGNTQLRLLSWADALNAVESALETPVQRENLNQLAALVRDFEADGDRPLQPESLTDLTTPRLMMSLIRLADEVVQRTTSLGFTRTDGLNFSSSRYGAGRYFMFDHAGAWLGLSHWYWAKFGTSPLWLTFSPSAWGRAADVRRIVEDWRVSDSPIAFDGEKGALAIGVPLQVRAERVRVVDECAKWLAALDQRLKAGGIAPLGPKPVPDPVPE